LRPGRGPLRLCDLPYRDVSIDVVDLEADGAAALTLDEIHTLVLVEPAQLVSPGHSQAERALGWLLFRASARGSAAGHPPPGAPTDLWFELSGRRLEGVLIEQAGWDDADAAAVALFEVGDDADRPGLRDGSEAAVCGIKIGGQERVVELPPSLLEQVGRRFEPPVRR
jgi:hypothetical protein